MNYTLKADINQLKFPKKLANHLKKKLCHSNRIYDLIEKYTWTCPKCLNRNKLNLRHFEKCSIKNRYSVGKSNEEINKPSLSSQCSTCFHISYFKKPCKYSKYLFVFIRYLNSTTHWISDYRCNKYRKYLNS